VWVSKQVFCCAAIVEKFGVVGVQQCMGDDFDSNDNQLLGVWWHLLEGSDIE
jgi:hypothetical protein